MQELAEACSSMQELAQNVEACRRLQKLAQACTRLQVSLSLPFLVENNANILELYELLIK